MLEIILLGVGILGGITYLGLELIKAERKVAEWQQAYTELAIELELKNLGVMK